MNCAQLASRIQQLQPSADPKEVARICLLLSNVVSDEKFLQDDENLKSAWGEISLRWQAATDQHLAMVDELERLAASDPRKFSAAQIWVLIRAIKVQGQMLQLYLGDPPASPEK